MKDSKDEPIVEALAEPLVPADGGEKLGYQVPTGEWKDGLCGCCGHGVGHPSLWNAWCCPLVLVGQINNRLKLTWLGALGNVRVLLAISIVYYVINSTLGSINAATMKQASGNSAESVIETEESTPAGIANEIIGAIFGLFVFVLVCQTRAMIRDRYSIPAAACGGLEDCCCAFFCSCCTVAQMARHTADYDEYTGVCCSDTGLSPDAPEIV